MGVGGSCLTFSHRYRQVGGESPGTWGLTALALALNFPHRGHIG
jgi:hypothetical protein